MKPFDYEAAKNGAPVCTRDGRPARIICFDRRIVAFPIIALVEDDKGTELAFRYTIEGRYLNSNKTDDLDLMMVSVHHEGWTNLYRRKDRTIDFDGLYNSERDAKLCANYCDYEYVTTAKIEWEE